MPAPKNPAVAFKTLARAATTNPRPNAARTSGPTQSGTCTRTDEAGGSVMPCVASGSAPARRLRGDVALSARRLTAIATRAAMTPPAAPAPSVSGATCRLSRVVPTASTHQVRNPYMMTCAYPTAQTMPKSPATTPITMASRQNSDRSVWGENPNAWSTPISRTRCSTPNRKNRLASSTAETTRKKLKYVKYSPQSVAPTDALSASARTGVTPIPTSTGSSLAARAWR